MEGIFDYYKTKANLNVASDIINKIVDSTILLQFQPKMGQVEELLKDRTNEYRYVIESNYKIIYWIEETNIKIASVFDCRQNPEKIQKV
ncbi:MAG: type II toxin-antitoxin system RelE/ParE family toxin [Bacteroidota bacterium]|nr:type II toxin-antitoxin system RelE/ParE family toxin [Bacteroidota bacterium]